jgi:hypothetical protein
MPGMRETFRHILPLNPTEADHIWSNAVVTVDANVLLDLYRYHEQTRVRLLDALRQFQGRTWLSHQAAEEFFRNRNGVIANGKKDFEDADAQIKSLEKAVATSAEKLRALRLVPREIGGILQDALAPFLEQAKAAIKRAADAHPDYFAADPLLEDILQLFDGAVGPAPAEAERESLRKEASRRRDAQIPPGYLDSSKEGDKRDGDFILWSQVLVHSAQQARPVILVTSERKEDWWEKHHGHRIGPRRELLEEAARIAKQRVVLYETEHFLNISAERRGEKVDARIVSDIRYAGLSRVPTPKPAEADPAEIVEQVLQELSYTLVNSDDVLTSLMAETNASAFEATEFDVTSAGPVNLTDATLPFEANVRFTGESDGERMFAGDSIVTQITGTLRFNGDEWEVDDYSLTGEVEDYSEDEDTDE